VRVAERPRQPLVQRTPREIRDDVAQQLAESPFIDVSDISVTVDGSEVTLAGTINSLIAISLAQALASNVAGVGRVQVRLRVRPAARSYETAGTPVHKIEGE
jgi:osmotically-inducible protein OsmY